jgi:hypothetical protein
VRCRYCFQAITERTHQCPHCGSHLPVAAPKTGRQALVARSETASPDPQEKKEKRPRPPMSRRQAVGMVGGLALVAACLCFGLVTLVQPALLPAPVLAVMPFLGTATPSPTPQVTPVTLLTPTPTIWETHTNSRAGFSIDFPAGWQVIDQTHPSWQDEVKGLAETYGWAETLFETGAAPTTPRSRAIDPAYINLANRQVLVFTIGQADLISNTLTYEDIEAIARNQPAGLARLAGGLNLIGSETAGYNFTSQRSERVRLNDQEALLVEFTADTEILAQPVRVRVRLYFVLDGQQVYLVSYFADETAATNNRAFYDQVVNSFSLNE